MQLATIRDNAKYFILFSVLTGILLLDQWTKHLIVQSFHLGESVPVVSEYFNLTYVRNTGAAFGLFAHSDPSFRVPFFIMIPLLALIVIGVIFRKIPNEDRKLSIALSMVIGGAVGNLIDRLHFGYVVDFLDFHWKQQYHFPAFNVADSAICVGVALLTLDLVIHTPPEIPKDLTSDRKDNPPNVTHPV